MQTIPFYVCKTVQGELANMVDKHCEVEAYCNDDAATDCQSKCYGLTYLTTPAASRGRHSWIHPPAGKERETLLHYLRQKREQRETTSACIVLPISKGKQQPWSALLKGMELLKQYHSRDRIYRRCQEGGKYAGGNVDVWYDPPDGYPPPPPIETLAMVQDPPDPTCLVASTALRTDMIFAVTIGNNRLVACVDTGATGNFITKGEIDSAKIKMKPSKTGRVKTAGGAFAAILGEAEVPFRMGSYSSTTKMFVLNRLLDGVNMVLGTPWQRDADVSTNCKHLRIHIGETNQTLYSLTKSKQYDQTPADYRNFVARSKGKPFELTAAPMTVKQAAKALKHGAEYILVSVRNRPHSTASPLSALGIHTAHDQPIATESRTETEPVPGAASNSTRTGAAKIASGGNRRGSRYKSYVRCTPESGCKHNLAPLHPIEEGVQAREEEESDGDTFTPARSRPIDDRSAREKEMLKGRGTPRTEQPESRPDLPEATGLIPKAKMDALLAKYADVFPDDLPAGLPPDRNIGHTIVLEPNTIPPYRKNRRMSPPEADLCETYIKDLLEKEFIAPSNSPFGAPVMFVAKPAGGHRVVCDWRALNNITIKNRYPLPRIDETLDRLGGSKLFTSLDLNSGYFQIRISPEDAHKTAFTTPHGQYEFKVLGQGLANSPATFQSVMNKIFAPHLFKFCVVYLDDIMIYSKTPAEHLQHIETVLKVLREQRFYAKLSKCTFNQSEVKFLGHIVGRDGLKVDPAKIEVVKNWPVPKDATQVRQFVGLTNYFRKFIKNYSSIAAPLMDLTRKGIDFAASWTDIHTVAFEELKTALTTSPVLVLPDFTKPFELVSDASLLGTGAVLLQEGKVIAYTSKKFIPAEKNYTTTEQEMLGIVTALGEWRCYFGASSLTLVTDHNPLQYFETQTVLSRRLARWQEFLAQFEYKWLYRSGRDNVADPLSRSPQLALMHYLCELVEERRSERIKQKKAKPKAANIPPTEEPSVTRRRKKVKTVHWTEPVSTPMADTDPQAPAPADTEDQTAAPVKELMDRIKAAYKADKLFRKHQHTKNWVKCEGMWMLGRKVVVPNDAKIRAELIAESHNPPYSGHCGRLRTLEKLRRTFYWKGMAKEVKAFVTTCDACQRNKAGNQKPGGLLQPTEVPEKFWDCVTMDLITQLPQTLTGYDAIAVFVDKLSKMVHIEPCKTEIDAPEFASLFIKTVFRHHGLPKSIISDRDSRFTGHFLTTVADKLGFRQRLSTAFHPQTDGQTERMNRVVEDMIRHYVGPYHDDWDNFLALVEFAINNSWQASIDNTPFHAMYGQHPHTPLSLQVGTEGPSRVPAAQEWLQEFSERIEHAKKCVLAAQDRQKKYADRSRRAVKYSQGQFVWLNSKHVHFKQGGPIKFMPKFIGPFKVLEVIGPRDPETQEVTTVTACKLDLPPTYRMHPVFHVSKLKEHKHDGVSPIQGPAPLEIDTDGTPVFEAEAILKEKVTGKINPTTWYLVHWTGYSPVHDSWVRESDMMAPELISSWQNRPTRPARPAKIRPRSAAAASRRRTGAKRNRDGSKKR